MNSVVAIQYPSIGNEDQGFEVICKVHGLVFDNIKQEFDAWDYAKMHNAEHILKPGCYITGGHYTLDEGSDLVVQIAFDRGFELNERDKVIYDNMIWNTRHLGITASPTNNLKRDSDSIFLSDLMDEAINYLNENWIEEGYWCGWHNGDFGVWANEEETYTEIEERDGRKFHL